MSAYDAIVVGARVAGAPTAMLLARQGHRVLLLDRARFPSDTISTHLMHPRGASYLALWGLLDRANALAPTWERIAVTREGITVRGTQPLDALRARLAALNCDDASYAVVQWAAPRRPAFDRMLADAAVESGAEFRDGAVVEELAFDGDRVCGVRGRTHSGTFEERARIVIGADGRHSFVARAAGAERYNERDRCTFAYYSYWSDLELDGVPWPASSRGRLGLSVYPSDWGLIHLVVFGPDLWWTRFKADVERNYIRIVEYVSPALAERVRAARREDRIYGTVDQPHYFHVPYGPGWALVGDAGYNKDQCTAIGMTHAVRDAELLARAVHAWLSGERSEGDALREYHERRDADALEYYELVANAARMEVMPRERVRIIAALARSGDRAQADRFVGVAGDVVAPTEFYSPENVAQLLRGAPDVEDLLRSYDEALATYEECPF